MTYQIVFCLRLSNKKGRKSGFNECHEAKTLTVCSQKDYVDRRKTCDEGASKTFMRMLELSVLWASAEFGPFL